MSWNGWELKENSGNLFTSNHHKPQTATAPKDGASAGALFQILKAAS